MSSEPIKKLFSAAEIEYQIEQSKRLAELDKKSLEYIDEMEDSLAILKKSNLIYRRRITRWLLCLLISLGTFFVLAGLIIPTDPFFLAGIAVHFDRVKDILINFGSGIIGTAVTFHFIRIWQNGETNYKITEQVLKLFETQRDMAMKLQSDTAEILARSVTYFRDAENYNTDPQRLDEYTALIKASISRRTELQNQMPQLWRDLTNLFDELESTNHEQDKANQKLRDVFFRNAIDAQNTADKNNSIKSVQD